IFLPLSGKMAERMNSIIQQLRRLNLPILAAMFALLGIGVVFIYSATYNMSGQEGMRLYEKQIGWAVIGFVCFMCFALTDYHRLTRSAWWLYVAGLIFLVLIFVPHVGLKMYGATRWLQLGGIRLFQPAELMKIAFVILLASLLGYPGRNVRRWRYSIIGMVVALLPTVLIIKQPDLGTAMIFFPVLLGMMFAAGVPGKVIASFLITGGLIVIFVIAVILLPPRFGLPEQDHKQLLMRGGISSYQRERILVFFDSRRDPLGSGWNKAQSRIAVGSGGLLGKGFLKGTQNILGFLPRPVAPTDFVFSVIAEEKGFTGALTILVLFGILLYGGLQAAAAACDKMGRLLCVGLMTMIFCHIFINIAMTVGLVPITGIPLPFISYGGTFMISTMSALGMVQSVYIRRDWK
ncbi:MAG: rod shape-determining protein RodA, partial [Kiritimatiellia bacterium]|nr:rod shape-determining protein RodA [Kiritimatiellia bacterium]